MVGRGPWKGHGLMFPAPENSGVNRLGLFLSRRAGCPCATKEKTRHLRIRYVKSHGLNMVPPGVLCFCIETTEKVALRSPNR